MIIGGHGSTNFTLKYINHRGWGLSKGPRLAYQPPSLCIEEILNELPSHSIHVIRPRWVINCHIQTHPSWWQATPICTQLGDFNQPASVPVAHLRNSSSKLDTGLKEERSTG